VSAGVDVVKQTQQEISIMRTSRWSGAVAAAAVLVFSACGDAAPEADQTPATTTQQPAQPVGTNVALPEGVTLDMVQQGKALFEGGVCTACHGPDANGTALAPSLRDQDWLNSDGSFEGIVGVIQTGVPQPVQYPGVMPPMGGGSFTEEQVRQLAAYVYAISHGG
jgi:mono/diheme cytochrome c family protein